ncbi:CRISPR locus-related DNA-binding protein [Haloferax sp. Atlit-19N]|uniref:CRISPR-associated CARF protein Csa3 n=1 Tax=Haloferax sp. Atlit-19N TaxID=2077201 RepID=UPI000E25D20E|nr:CRISPR-associated CARF protein Csa3 [Haloferax sp. Atlit-19N]RDZ43720.1 CRISPR locus-related DNA-binding protein [Haloferax sp. Atlit-19N]
MRTYLSPIGFNSTSVTRPLLRHGLDMDDRVVVVRPTEGTDEARSKEAIADVRRLLGEIEPKISLSVERVPHDEFEEAVLYCRDIIHAAEGELVVNLSGGARDVFLPFATAVLSESDRVSRTLCFSDIDGRVRELSLPNLSVELSESVAKTLAAIEQLGGKTSIPELTETGEQAKSTVTRHVTELESHGAVVSEKQGKIKYVSMTLTGELLLGRR